MAVLTSVVILRPSNVIRLTGGKDFNENGKMCLKVELLFLTKIKGFIYINGCI